MAKIFGISAVRNEADIIGLTVLHHLRLGLDGIIVMDNGSTDETKEVLQTVAKLDPRLQWFSDGRPFVQTSIATELASEALRQGADWIVPFDADEFWASQQAKTNFRDLLESSEAGSLWNLPVNFIQARHHTTFSPSALLDATYCVYEPVPSGNLARQLLEANQIGMVQTSWVRKHISRPTSDIKIGRGNHSVEGIRGSSAKENGLLCLHIPLRSKAYLQTKMDDSQRLAEAGILEGAWHIWHWAREIQRGNLDKEWAANSQAEGQLDVHGERYNLLFDPRLKKAVQPLVKQAESVYEEVRATRAASG